MQSVPLIVDGRTRWIPLYWQEFWKFGWSECSAVDWGLCYSISVKDFLHVYNGFFSDDVTHAEDFWLFVVGIYKHK